MALEHRTEQIPTILWIFQAGGLVPLVIGLIIAALGIVVVIRPNRTAAFLVATLSLLPAIIGMYDVHSAAAEFGELAVLSTPPKPAAFAATMGRASGGGFFALVGTIIPSVISILAWLRVSGTSNHLESERATNQADEVQT